jgi:YD repeat-containing protein
VLTTISPIEGRIDELPLRLRLTGKGFVSASVVRAGGTEIQTQFISNNELVATLPTTLFSISKEIPISVFTPSPGGGLSATVLFRIIASKVPSPVITSFTPTEGPAGTVVTLTGTNFLPGPTSLQLDGFKAKITSITETMITTTVPESAPTASFYVTSQSGTAVSKTVFTVTKGLPPQTARAVHGEVLKFEGDPLTGVRLSVGNQSAIADTAGRFTLFLPVGRSIVDIDPSAVGLPPMKVIVDIGSEPNPRITLLLPEQSTPGTLLIVSSLVPDGEVIFYGGAGLKKAVATAYGKGKAMAIVSKETVLLRHANGSIPHASGVHPTKMVIIDHEGFVPNGPMQVIHASLDLQPPGSPGTLLYWDPASWEWYPFMGSRVSKDGRRVLPLEKTPPPILSAISCGPPPTPLPPSQDGGCQGGSCDTGDPIDAMTGALVVLKTDIGIPGLVMQLSHWGNNTIPGPFGPGTRVWSDATLSPYGNGLLYKSQRIEAYFLKQPNGTYLATDTPSVAGAVISVSSDGLTKTLHFKNGRQQEFNAYWHLTKDLNKFSRGIIQTWNAQGQLVSISSTDSEGSIVFSYNYNGSFYNGTVNKVQVQDKTGALGASVSYDYLNGQLHKVIGPDAGATEYGYDDTTGLMTTINDPRGITYLQNEYDDHGRLFRQTLAEGGGTSTMRYSDNTFSMRWGLASSASSSAPTPKVAAGQLQVGGPIRHYFTVMTNARGVQRPNGILMRLDWSHPMSKPWARPYSG